MFRQVRKHVVMFRQVRKHVVMFRQVRKHVVMFRQGSIAYVIAIHCTVVL